MGNYISSLEEFDIQSWLQNPHMFFPQTTLVQKKQLAYLILSKKDSDILLMTSLSLKNECILAGLSYEHMEYIAKYGPREYKEQLFNSFMNGDILESIIQIVSAMDDDAGGKTSVHKERVVALRQYLQDNQVVFKF